MASLRSRLDRLEAAAALPAPVAALARLARARLDAGATLHDLMDDEVRALAAGAGHTVPDFSAMSDEELEAFIAGNTEGADDCWTHTPDPRRRLKGWTSRPSPG